jgi:putative OPT family oligopeptide transporter
MCPESAGYNHPGGQVENSSSTPNNAAEKFVPVIPAHQTVAEVTWRAIILGSIISVLFGVANAYLGLKFGMTVSSSIPAAVISMAVLRLLFHQRRATVLENNIVQTVGSAGESLAAGLAFTIPAFFIWGANEQLAAMGYVHEVSKMQIFWFSMLGGALGIFLMIPLRKYLVDKEHGNLRFPEGTACAEVIVAGDEGGGKAKMVFTGIGLGALYKIGYDMLRIWSQTPSYDFKKFLKGGTLGIDATPALLGVGYIIGPRISALMLSGAVLGYLGIGPLLSFIGDQIPGTIIAPGLIPLNEMDPAELRNSYIKYLGVGAVTVGGFVSLLKSFPVIVSAFGKGFGELFGKRVGNEEAIRTDRDLPMKWVLLGVVGVIVAIWILPGTGMHLLGVALAVLFGFLFVVVAARIVGIVGSSSSPVSGMTIATLLVSCLVLVYFGASGVSGMISAMSIGAVVCIAVCMSGDIAQDLKTGFLLGATPRKQQLTEFIGLLFPAIAMGFTIYFLNDAFGFTPGATEREPLLAPQANIMATVVQGVMNANLPWEPILVGGIIALAIEMLGIASLPVAIGLYLPLSLSTPIMSGGLIALIVKKRTSVKQYAERNLRGVLFASGMVAGDALMGVLVAFMIGSWGAYAAFYDSHSEMLTTLTGGFGPWLALILFGGMMAIMAHMAFKGMKKGG